MCELNNLIFKFGIITATIMLIASLSESVLVCYDCSVDPPTFGRGEKARPCSQFNTTPHFQVECPHSTFCMKKSFKMELPNGEPTTVVERHCASQINYFQSYEERSWHSKRTIEKNAYSESCVTSSQPRPQASTTEYCYCRSNLCNSAKSTQDYSTGFHHTDTMAVIIVFNAVKYIRSLR